MKKGFKNGPPQRNLKKKKTTNGGVKGIETQGDIAELSRMKSGLKLWLIHVDIW